MPEFQALIIYGDGLQALYCDEKNPQPDKNGSLVIPILVVPSDELKSVYNLTDDDLPIEVNTARHGALRGIWVEYPFRQVKWLRKSPIGACVLIFCAFNRSKTELMKYYNELFEMDELSYQTESRLRAENAYLRRELDDIMSNPTEFLRRYMEAQEMGMKENIEKGEEHGY
jgi:hypothetical protein